MLVMLLLMLIIIAIVMLMINLINMLISPLLMIVMLTMLLVPMIETKAMIKKKPPSKIPTRPRPHFNAAHVFFFLQIPPEDPAGEGCQGS